MAIELVVPEVGESIQEAILVQWFKNDGDSVQKDEPLFLIETDKVTLEVVAEAGGRLAITAKEGQTVAIGAVVGSIDTGVQAEAATESAAEPPAAQGPAPVETRPAAKEPAPPETTPEEKRAQEIAEFKAFVDFVGDFQQVHITTGLFFCSHLDPLACIQAQAFSTGDCVFLCVSGRFYPETSKPGHK